MYDDRYVCVSGCLFAVSTRKPTIKRESEAMSIKNEPMTPSIHNSSRHSMRDHVDEQRDDRRRQRQLKASASDEEKNEWSDNDEDDLSDDNEPDEKGTLTTFMTLPVHYSSCISVKTSLEQNTMTDEELNDFLIGLVKKHGLATIKQILKSNKYVGLSHE
jgi:hypothetical protein